MSPKFNLIHFLILYRIDKCLDKIIDLWYYGDIYNLNKLLNKI